MSTAYLAGEERPVAIDESLAQIARAFAILHGLDPDAAGVTLSLAAVEELKPDIPLDDRVTLRVTVTGSGEGFAPASRDLGAVIAAGLAALDGAP